MTSKVESLLEKYAETFGDGFPTIPLAWGRSEQELIEMIEMCLEKRQNVYELGMVKEDRIY